MSVWCNRTLLYLHCHFGLCLSEQAFEREMKDLGVLPRDWPPYVLHEYADATTHFFEYKDKHCVLVCMTNWEGRDPIQVASLLVHEAVHIWQRYCDHIGERTPSNEFEAYAIQTISQELMEAFKRQATGRKRRLN